MKIYIVVPCYNEEAVLPWSINHLQTLTERLKQEEEVEARLLFVDDGSRDGTWKLITDYARQYQNVSGLKLSHNEGHQNALWAGLEQTVGKCDAAVSIDADLQDDETAIIEMARQVKTGKDIVYGVRKRRDTDTAFKRVSAQLFYRLMKQVDKEIVFNHADFRMMTSRAIEALMQYSERNLFLRGVVRQLGFNEGFVYYDRTARVAGESKYPFRKMLAFSIDGITSFSVAPLKWITVIGLAMMLVSVVAIIYAIIEHIAGKTVAGWTSLLASLWFIGGIVTTGIGVTGIYVGKIYTEVKRRPRYFVDERINL
ncbi:putative bactoprenol glucosyl transferase-like protein [Prevotella sp. DNF00663]|uniref:glycosyltransferase family 2 protein n=1 Tax=Prevotella sp. DNF00663 TaxID=1384078 RepID=UPI0007818870|nr:glycosyltransferase family 2 protein [Prevotella sp. DNF00663]KXB78871.1 putative bactoprenol glucosyl transferase-like protein [Prevotella sp. DNF00663]